MITSENPPSGDFSKAQKTAGLLEARHKNLAERETRPSSRTLLIYYFMCAICALVMFNINGVVRGVYGLERAASIPLVLLCIAVIVSSGSTAKIYLNSLTGSFILFMITYIGLGMLSIDRGRGLDTLRRLAEVGGWLVLGVSVFCGSVYLTTKGMLERFMKVLVLIVLASDLCIPIFLYKQIYLFSPVNEAGLLQERSSGLFANPNEGGLVAAIGLCLALSGFAGRLGVLSSAIFLATTFLVFSRGAILSCVGVIVVAGFLRFKNWKANLITISVFLLFVGIQFFFVEDLVGSGLLTRDQEWRLLSLSKFWAGESSLHDIDSGRIGLIGDSLNLIGKSPMVGYGLGQMFEMLQGIGSHNQFLAIALEAGVPAAILMVWLILVWGWTGFRLEEEASRVVVSTLATWFLISCFFSHNLMDLKLSPIVIGLGLGIASAKDRRSRRSV
jgi:hypothetical protein